VGTSWLAAKATLVAAGVKERIGGDRERGDVLLLNSLECYVAIGAGPQDGNLQAAGGRRAAVVSSRLAAQQIEGLLYSASIRSWVGRRAR
jgi:hypothetical protein